MNEQNDNLVIEFCLNCNKTKCRGNCEDFRQSMKSLRKQKLITDKGGKRPKTQNL